MGGETYTLFSGREIPLKRDLMVATEVTQREGKKLGRRKKDQAKQVTQDSLHMDSGLTTHGQKQRFVGPVSTHIHHPAYINPISSIQ